MKLMLALPSYTIERRRPAALKILSLYSNELPNTRKKNERRVRLSGPVRGHRGGRGVLFQENRAFGWHARACATHLRYVWIFHGSDREFVFFGLHIAIGLALLSEIKRKGVE